MSRKTLYAWKNQLPGGEAPATIERKTKHPLDPEIADLERQREALQRAIHELRIEHDLLKTASNLIEKDLGGDLQDLSNRQKTQLIVAQKSQHKPLEFLMRLRLVRSSYLYHRTRISLEDKYLQIRQAMKDAFERTTTAMVSAA